MTENSQPFQGVPTGASQTAQAVSHFVEGKVIPVLSKEPTSEVACIGLPCKLNLYLRLVGSGQKFQRVNVLGSPKQMESICLSFLLHDRAAPWIFCYLTFDKEARNINQKTDSLFNQ